MFKSATVTMPVSSFSPELEDITRALFKEDVQDICEDLGLKVTGSKDEFWESIVTELGLTTGKVKPKEPKVENVYGFDS